MGIDIRIFCVLSVLVEPAFGFAVYTVSDDVSSWTLAMISCQLATPPLVGNDIDKTANFEHSVDMIEGEEAWIGYLSEKTVYEYIGCADRSMFQNVSTETNIDLGDCSVACSDYTYFGLMLTRCFCFNKLPSGNTHRGRCTRTCNSPRNEAVCGGGDYVSMYTHVKGLEYRDLTMQALEIHRGSCIMYDQNKRQFLPSKCTTAYEHNCQTANGLFDNNEYLDAKRWLDMANFCYGTSTFPFTYATAIASSGYKQMWTGMVTTRRYFTDAKFSKDKAYAVYVARENGRYIIKFSDDIVNEKRKYICQKDYSTHPTSSTPSTTSTTEKVAPLTQPEEGDDMLLVYIIVPIVVVIILLVIIIIVCIKRRKGRKGHLDIDSPYKNNGHAHNHDMAAEFDDFDDSITLKHLEEHHDDLDYSNVSTLRISDKGYTNEAMHGDDHSVGNTGTLNGRSPKEEYQYSTIQKELKQALKNRESYDPTYDTTKPNHAPTGHDMNYDRANYGESSYDPEYSDVALHDDKDHKDGHGGTVGQGLSRF